MALHDITAEHVRQALPEIDREGINNSHRGLVTNGYELLDTGKVYSPKYVISIAHKYVDGQELASNTFNSVQAKDYLEQLGFMVTRGNEAPPVQTNLSMYTWVPFYQEMCPKLLHYSPAELIGLIKQVLKVQNLVGLKDQDADGNVMELADMDPYTFLSFINKSGNVKRLVVLALLKDVMYLTTPAPTDVNGLPTAQAQSVWMFAYAYLRQPNDIEQLRTLYEQAENEALTTQLFDRVRMIRQVGPAKLTEALFCQKSTDYLPINSQTKPWLKKRNLPFRYETLADYRQLLESVRQTDPRPFYEISWEAYLENNPPAQPTATKYYCVGVTFGEQGDQLDRFVREGIWQNGYGDEREKYLEIIKNIPVGAKLAAKSSFTQGPHGETVSVLQVKAIGEVIANGRDGQTLEVVWDEDVEPFSLTGKGSYRKTVQEVTKAGDIQLIFFHQPDQSVELMPSPDTQYARNIILYGPPGTGKTYETIDLAVDIIDGRKDPSHQVNKERFDQLQADHQIEFITFHQNYTYEDFVMGLRPDVDGDDLKFQRSYGVFYRIAKQARDNYEATYKPEVKASVFQFNKAFDQFIKPVKDGSDLRVKMDDGNEFFIADYQEKLRAIWVRIPTEKKRKYISVQTLSEMYRGVKTIEDEGPLYKSIVNLLDPPERPNTERDPVQLQNYVLIIDEINRANMSRVFGELITLLEDDKRLGGDNELTVTLPSGEPFAVPPNLYLIGTMNTADKSLALLDIALRRRFEFIYQKPDSSVLEERTGTILDKLN